MPSGDILWHKGIDSSDELQKLSVQSNMCFAQGFEIFQKIFFDLSNQRLCKSFLICFSLFLTVSQHPHWHADHIACVNSMCLQQLIIWSTGAQTLLPLEGQNVKVNGGLRANTYCYCVEFTAKMQNGGWRLIADFLCKESFTSQNMEQQIDVQNFYNSLFFITNIRWAKLNLTASNLRRMGPTLCSADQELWSLTLDSQNTVSKSMSEEYITDMKRI